MQDCLRHLYPAVRMRHAFFGGSAACALLDMFTRLAFAVYVMTPSQARLALFVFERLLKLLRTVPCPHNEQQIYTLARLVGQLRGVPSRAQSDEAACNEEIFAEHAHVRETFERNGRWTSRSRSRAAGCAAVQLMAHVNAKPRDALWGIPDIVPFSLENSEKGSRQLVTYDPQKPADGVVLPV
ncbi:hypothetical protein DFH11DRAFT_1736790 [Phellopilus nigrolimitatus]|nr:hypothetical protein DFH11DRAFT_1736790 [Phellopilus nigrolimitatus]